MKEGRLLRSRYRILDILGQGGMGLVYLAWDMKTKKRYAIKEISLDLSCSKDVMAEAYLLKKLRHPGLPKVLDLFQEDNYTYLVLSYIEGRSLFSMIKEEGVIDENRAVDWAEQIGSILTCLHAQKPPIIYRDLKPSNIMVNSKGRIILIDFGAAMEEREGMCLDGDSSLGTRGYAAPEQYREGENIDARTDIFCFGACMFHILTGHSPAELTGEAYKIGAFVTSYKNSGLEKFILRCTRERPEDRFQDCVSMLEALKYYKKKDDRAFQKRKVRKKRLFLLLGTSIGIVTSFLLFHVLHEKADQNAFMNIVELAREQNSLKEAKVYVDEALELDDYKPETYLALMEKAREEIEKRGGVYDAEVMLMVNSSLNGSKDGLVAHIDHLKELNPDVYAELEYELGIWDFFLRGDSNTAVSAAVKCFENIIEGNYMEYLGDKEKELALLLYRMGSYYGEQNVRLGKHEYEKKNSVTVFDLFGDLKTMTEANLSEKVEKESYAIQIYKRIAVLASLYSDLFYENDIKMEEVVALVDEVLEGLAQLDVGADSQNYKDYLSAIDAVQIEREKIIKAAN